MSDLNEVLEEEKQAPEPYELTGSRATTAFFVWFVSQLIFGFILGVYSGFYGEDSPITTDDIGVLSVYGTAVCLCFWVFKDVSKGGVDYQRVIGFQKGDFTIANALFWVFIAFVAIRVASGLYASLQPEAVELIQNGAGEKMLTASKDGGIGIMAILTYLMVIIVAPIIEEIVFRGYIQNSLEKKYNPQIAVLITSVLFAIIHFNLAVFPLYFILGVGFGVLFVRTRSLWTVILLHILNNSLAVVYQLFFVA
ncbi:CPBP family intramembrane glutamic endopeptidase [Kordiimonas laminariae]|uniref:CPBP family intramembrane glutamic endopeptidase n=1 Tax=Kordiimonas laminariae TaxID=2917717 RepID=UPI001FF4E687|nr:CPBP family intramembrane glutamic endopeptidase [Kordiimonas laminariae]MCK0068509.1 CPBP family intramembrane metalloprotease [Kordiimonas laminariae]